MAEDEVGLYQGKAIKKIRIDHDRIHGASAMKATAAITLADGTIQCIENTAEACTCNEWGP